jgi:hypothetical protein
MAGTTVPARRTGLDGSDVETLRLQYNKSVADLDLIQAKINAIITAAATNIAAVAAVAALGSITAAKVADNNGNTT